MKRLSSIVSGRPQYQPPVAAPLTNASSLIDQTLLTDTSALLAPVSDMIPLTESFISQDASWLSSQHSSMNNSSIRVKSS
jgi:hypothetical protein